MKTIYTFLILLALGSLTNAQPAMPDEPNKAPIDGGISILLASGAALGAAKYKQLKKRN
jgi:hypothetical protein